MDRFTDRPDMTIAVFRGRKTSKQQQIYFMTVCRSDIHLTYICH